jgi:hypothetical protein
LRCSATLHRYLSSPAERADDSSPEPLLFFFIALGFPLHLAIVLCEFLP